MLQIKGNEVIIQGSSLVWDKIFSKKSTFYSMHYLIFGVIDTLSIYTVKTKQ